METFECLYCHYDIDVNENYVPDLDNNEEWDRIAEFHSPSCTWVLTRAHRINVS